ncbi:MULTISPECIES: SDR family oxidoreductase [unclassified Rhodococcus (in: high G+C Gram-positive bacteria)]|uniref:SDR family oxidoreductase n=1 Tax=unclassified Rhodococcus (in: high G+C Gram-positive bacteria) TaxID=192944 RepID=UPI0006FC6DEC|nr:MULTISPECIES: SDR family NAD(P)-dependent oxidoreductase [unclassified Rhodococcus (in: high G+C Gram-positive bacteria)]KQU28539.1 oxidoreductase [Rhodococcus sp. Leaf225]KQU47545.1 oxidoreductase [Rhodococcus sp. Leaf258]
MKSTGNTIVITGGTSGIGLGLAERFHEAGNTVIVAGRRVDLLDRITAEHPGMESLVLDVTDPDSISRAQDTVRTNHPDVNVLINNAGIMMRENILDSGDLSVAESHVETNLLGTIRMTYAFLPLLKDRDDATLINVTSSLAFVPYPITPTYSATKAALHSFTETLRIQLAEAGSALKVVEMVPPGVRTTLLGQQDDDQAMPLDEFLGETMDLLRNDPNADEVVVHRARVLRNAVSDGSYNDILAMMSSR